MAKSFARIHKANLCNFGILPLTFKDPGDYDRLEEGDSLVFPGIRSLVENKEQEIPAQINGEVISLILDVSDRQRKHLLAGGALNFVRKELQEA
jgi:aconitate hydratase